MIVPDRPLPRIAILHYSAPPVVGGVEAVIHAHAGAFIRAGYAVAVVAGRGDRAALPSGADFYLIPEMDSQHPAVRQASSALESGQVPVSLNELTDRLELALAPVLDRFENVIVHNVFTKHFNLPLTAALYRLLDAGRLPGCLAWCHDITWSSPNSRSKVFPGYPWDLLRAYRPDVTYVAVSKQRQQELAGLLGCSEDQIHVVYNGVDPATLLGLSPEVLDLAGRLDLFESDLTLLMPVRVTQAKNVEYALQVLNALKAHGLSPRLIVTGPPDPHDEQSMVYFHSLQGLRAKLDLEQEMRFVFESGPHPEYTIGVDVVGELLRLADVLFMPSHREGFGMPVLEAGLAGVPVVSTAVPAAQEIGGDDVIRFDAGSPPHEIAAQIAAAVDDNPLARLRRRVRRRFTWQAIVHTQIEPLLRGTRAR